MLRLLAELLPLGLAAAVSPVMLTEQTVLLSGANGVRTALSYAAGTVVVLLVVVGAIVGVGQSLSLPTAPRLNATLDLTVGALLLALALLVHYRPHRTQERRPRPAPRRLGVWSALGFGGFAMATNFTTLAIIVPAAKDISAAPLDMAERLVAALLLVGLACLPAWGPVAIVPVAPTITSRLLAGLQRAIHRWGRLGVVVLFGGAGAFFLVRGLVRLITE